MTENICGDCVHFEESQFGDEEGYCLLKTCVTGRAEKIAEIPCFDGFEMKEKEAMKKNA